MLHLSLQAATCSLGALLTCFLFLIALLIQFHFASAEEKASRQTHGVEHRVEQRVEQRLEHRVDSYSDIV